MAPILLPRKAELLPKWSESPRNFDDKVPISKLKLASLVYKASDTSRTFAPKHFSCLSTSMVAEPKNTTDVNTSPSLVKAQPQSNPKGPTSKNEKLTVAPPEEPFSVFTRSEKWLIVSLTALAGLFRRVKSYPFRRNSSCLTLDAAPLQQTYTSLHYLPFQGTSTSHWN